MSKKQKTSTSEVNKIKVDDLPKVLTVKWLQKNNCKDIIRYLSMGKNQIKTLQITKIEFKQLTDNIDSKEFDKLYYTEGDVPFKGYYALKEWPVIHEFVKDPEIQKAANKFYTKCLFKYLYDTYEGITMKHKWYDAVKKKNKLDLKNFRYFTNVTSIGDSAFKNNQLTSVTIPGNVTSIGDSAFNNNQLTSVTIPGNVTRIGNNAFYNNQLTRVMIPYSVTSIGFSAFERNQLTRVRISASVTSIGDFAFSKNQLTSVTIPSSVTSIGIAAFSQNKLTKVVFYPASSVETIGAWAFKNNQLTSVTIPGNVTSIGDSAFKNNQLTSVRIPNSVTSIGASAFRQNQLTTVSIPASVTELADNAFDPNVDIIREGVAITESSNSLLQLKF